MVLRASAFGKVIASAVCPPAMDAEATHVNLLEIARCSPGGGGADAGGCDCWGLDYGFVI